MRDVVAVLSPFVGGDYYGTIIRGVSRAATRVGARVVAVQTLDPGARTADASGIPRRLSPAATGYSDGAVVLPGALGAEHALALLAAGTPLVLVGHELPGVPAPTVRAGNHEGVRAAVAHLAGHGHRRVAFAGFTGAGDVAERRDAYLDAVRAQGLDGGGDLLLEIPDNHEAGGVAAADRLLAGLDASAVVLGTDRNAMGLLQRLRDAGRTVPGDVAVVGFDDIPACRYQHPALTSVRQPLEGLGAAAFAAVRVLASGGALPAGAIRLPAELVVRASCGCPDPGLQLTDAEARAQFESLEYLQTTLNTRHDLDIELLGSHRHDPRDLAWLSTTPAEAGVLGLWRDDVEHGDDVGEGGGAAGREPRELVIAGTYGAEEPLPVTCGAVLTDVDFPPLPVLDRADGAAGSIVFVVPVRQKARDWGLLAAVGRIQFDTPPGRELMNHSGAVLAAALEREVMLASLAAQREELHRLALHDQLTGLPNRAQLTARLEATARRSLADPAYRYGLVFVDLDGFKEVNDTYGHAVGDALLTVIGDRLARITRVGDVVARLGGDEFLLLIETVDGPGTLRELVRRLRRTVRRPAVIDGRRILPAASVGVVTSTGGEAPDELLRRADAAMYRAKARAKARAARSICG